MSANLEILEESVQSGEEIMVELQSPDDAPFIEQLRIFKDPDPADVDAEHWPLTNSIGAVSIGAEQASVEIGTPFTVTVNTLNYAPGDYYFMTFPQGDFAPVHDHVVIMPMDEAPLAFMRADMTAHDRLFALYSEGGAFVADNTDDAPPPVLLMDSIYVAAANLNLLDSFDNIVHVNFFDASGLVLEKADIMKIYVVRNASGIQTLAGVEQGPGGIVDLTDYPDGIALVHFRTPKHQKYYEYDGQLHFTLAANTSESPDPDLSYYTIETHLDDAAAHPEIPYFEAYNSTTYPGQAWRNDFPFDTRHVRLVRFGNGRLTTVAELDDLAAQLEVEFSEATKDYFRLIVDGHYHYPLVQPFNQEKVINWYLSAPKTPDKEFLELADPDQLYLAALLYYYEHAENEFVSDMTTVYPMLSNGEELTIYLFDGPGSLGQAMGADGNRVKVNRLYPGYMFYQGEGEDRTYHLDLESFPPAGGTLEGYLEWISTDGSTNQKINTTIHELGHTSWLKKAGVSTGDLSTRKYPFISDIVYEDDSVGYFTRFEYMSYGRDRNILAGITYGDDYLERILMAYAKPEAWISFLSHPDEGDQTITVSPGEEISFELNGSAGSGLRMLWYFNQSSPVPLGYGTPQKFGVWVYDSDAPRVKLDHKEITFVLDTPGTYIYRYRSRSRLYPIVWQPHQSITGTFAIVVEE